jgi:hypothetical protein
MYERNVKMLL